MTANVCHVGGDRRLDVDYVVYGAGAMGMAFVDTLLAETDATVALVDRRSQPGGHWNDAYAFVRLHQASKWYGVNSRPLERSGNPLDLASRSEVLAYYEAVMEKLLSSGRLQYFPACVGDDTGARTFRSLLEPGRSYAASDRATIVDATYMKTEVPATSDPRSAGRYDIDDGGEVVPVNALSEPDAARERFVVIGAGKTGMDAVLWLQDAGVDADRITWIVPRDAWVITRDLLGPDAFARFDMLGILEANRTARTCDEWHAGMERVGMLQRLDSRVRPGRSRCATASQVEMERLRRVRNVVRLGRVKRVERGRILLEQGELPTGTSTLIVDCSADGLPRLTSRPVFSGGRITLQPVETCQQVFSAALIGHLEARGGSEHEKNKLCTPVPHPDTAEEFLASLVASRRNRLAWESDAELAKWLSSARLNGLQLSSFLAQTTPEILPQAWKNYPRLKTAAWAIRNLRRILVLSKKDERASGDLVEALAAPRSKL